MPIVKRRAKGRGGVFLPQRSAIYWLKFTYKGTTYREATGKTNEREALKICKVRIPEIVSEHNRKIEESKAPPPKNIYTPATVAELADDLISDYTIRRKATLDDVEARCRLHLKPYFGTKLADDLTTADITAYIQARQAERAQDATINRELAALRRMLKLGYKASPPRVSRLVHIELLPEPKTRKGFIDKVQYEQLKLHAARYGDWLHGMLALGFTLGWRVSEIQSLRVNQINLLEQTVRLHTSKNEDPRVGPLDNELAAILARCIQGKSPEDFVFTRKTGKPIRDFRKAWKAICDDVGIDNIFHDLRRSGAKNLRDAGVPESVIMSIGGWRTASVFRRYAIVGAQELGRAREAIEAWKKPADVRIGTKRVIARPN